MASEAHSESYAISTEQRPSCLVCKESGDLLYQQLNDKLYPTPGRWSLKQCSNSKCGLAWLDPAPVRSDLHKLYLDYYTHVTPVPSSESLLKRTYLALKSNYLALKYGYFKGTRLYTFRWFGVFLYLFPLRRQNVDFEVMYLPFQPGGRVLEIGCGSGSLLQTLHSLGWQTEGVDFDPRAVEHARSKGLNVRLGTLSEQNYPAESFDAVVMSHVIEHVPDPLALLSEIHRILRPGGILSSVTPNINSIGRKVWKQYWQLLDPPRHLYLFDTKSMNKSAEMAGFKKVSQKTTVRDITGTFYASMIIKKFGKFDMTSRPRGILKFGAVLLGLAEWAILSIFPNSGEEISYLGRKQ